MRQLEKRNIYLASNAPHKQEAFEKIITGLLGGRKDYGGSLTETSTRLFGVDDRNLVARFISAVNFEPSGLAQFAAPIQEKIKALADLDATFKTGIGLLTIIEILSQFQEQTVRRNGNIHAEVSVGMDSRIGYIKNADIFSTIQNCQTEDEIRDVIHSAFLTGDIVFRHKATRDDLPVHIKEMEESVGFLNETVVKAVGVVYGVGSKHNLELTGINPCAFLCIGKFDEKKKEQIRGVMLKHGEDVTGGLPTQDMQDCFKPIYMGRMIDKNNVQERYDALMGVPAFAVRRVISETDYDIKRILYYYLADYAENALLAEKGHPLEKFGYWLAHRFGKHKELSSESIVSHWQSALAETALLDNR
jgi:hypothetical protein